MRKISNKLIIILIASLEIFFARNSFCDSKILCISASNGLKYTKNDAIVMGKAFGRYAGFRRSNIRILHSDEKTTKKAIFKEVKNWLAVDVKNDDMTVLFLAGHGIVNDDRYYFVPTVDGNEITDIFNSNKKLISRDDLISLMSLIPTQNRLLILDTCYSGAMIKDAHDLFRTELTPNAQEYVRSIFIKPVEKVINTTKIQTDSSSLNFTIISACKNNEVAYESKKFRNGILTYYLVKILKEKAWELKVFDAEEICNELQYLSSRDGWTQKAVMSGGTFFKATLDTEKISPFTTF
jgi:uncharacterized caspase-like protein